MERRVLEVFDITHEAFSADADTTTIAGTGRHDERGGTESPIAGQAFVKLDPLKITQEQRLDAHACIQAGDLSFLLHPGQQRMWDFIDEVLYTRDEPLVVFNVSRRGGKSFGMVARCFQYLMGRPGDCAWYLAPTGKQLEDIVSKSIEHILLFFPKHLLPKRRGHTWTFPNGATFQLFGVAKKKGANLRGNEASLVVLDECRDIPNIKRMIAGEINPIFQNNCGKLILISTPPDTPLHEFITDYVEPAIDYKCYFHATYKDNPLLRETDEQLRRKFPKFEEDPEFRREYLADWTVADKNRLVIKTWDEEANDKWLAEFAKDRPHIFDAYMAFDKGFSEDHTGMVFGYFDWRYKTLIIEGEFSAPHTITAQIADHIRATERSLGYGEKCVVSMKRYSDVDSGQFMADLQQTYGLDVYQAHKQAGRDRKDLELMILEDEIRRGRVRIRPQCPILRRQLKSGVWNDRGTDYARTTADGHLDVLDATRFMVMSVNWTLTYQGEAVPTVQNRQDTLYGVHPGRLMPGRRPSWTSVFDRRRNA